MKWKQMTKWCWLESRFTMLILFLILIALYSIQTVSRSFYGTGVNITGSDVAIFITLFVVGIVLFAETLRFGLMQGVSRRSVFLGLAANGVILGILAALGNAAVLLIGGIKASPGGNAGSVFGEWYDAYIARVPAAAAWFAQFVWLLFGVVLFFAVGLFVGGVFYRLGRVGRACWAAGLPIGLFVVLPLLFSYLPAPALQAIIKGYLELNAFLVVSPYRMSLLFLAAAAVFMAVNWLLIRRAPLR